MRDNAREGKVVYLDGRHSADKVATTEVATTLKKVIKLNRYN
jgi:hypothetical protein